MYCDHTSTRASDKQPAAGIQHRPLSQMASLHLDPQYLDSYSECGSSNSSFSYGLLTPTSTAEFSAATSRRQSIASEVRSCNESAFNRVPSFSSEDGTEPFETPPPYRLASGSGNFSPETQGCETRSSPLEVHHRRRGEVASTIVQPQFHDPFTSQAAYLGATATSALDVDIDGDSQLDGRSGLGSRFVPRQLMEWPAFFNSASEPDYGQAHWGRMTDDFGFDPSVRLDIGFVQSDLLSTPALIDFDLVNGTPTERDPLLTVAPQETFVSPSSSVAPSTPISQRSESAFQTPVVKSEVRISSTGEDEATSSYRPRLDDESPSKRKFEFQEREELLDALKHLPSRPSSRSSMKTRKSITRTQPAVLPCEVKRVTSSNKKHYCPVCDIKFDRPEHHKRHEDTKIHVAKCRERKKGLPKDSKAGTKKFKCRVPKCDSAFTRKDNEKPHYMKTHFYPEEERKQKRNDYVSPEEAAKLGLAHWDPRTEYGRSQLESSKPRRGGSKR